MAVEPNKVQVIFNATETNLLLVAINASIAACKRGINTAKSPKFKVLFEEDLRGLTALDAKIRGFNG